MLFQFFLPYPFQSPLSSAQSDNFHLKNSTQTFLQLNRHYYDFSCQSIRYKLQMSESIAEGAQQPPTQANHSNPLPPQPPVNLLESLSLQWSQLSKIKNPQQLAVKIKEYCLTIVTSGDDQLFVNYFIEHKFMQFLHRKMREHATCPELLRSAFSLLEFLLKALKKEEQLVYFLVKVSQQGLVSEGELFAQQEDKAYFANFLKLLVRKVNEDPKYIAVFVNSREPHFPLLLQLLRICCCRDQVMRTSSQLAVLELSNNRLLDRYMRNFPFVLFYPLCLGGVVAGVRAAVEGLGAEELTSGLKYMQDFVGEKERAAVDMYTNTFLATLGRLIYAEISTLSEKTVPRVINLFKVLIDCVLPELSVVKIRTALFCLFAPTISHRLRKSLEARTPELDHYWIPEYCSDQITEHCKSIYFKEEREKTSIFRMFNSYIPRSWGNWLSCELKKLSELIGFEVTLYSPIDCEQYREESFLRALWTMVDDRQVPNQLFNSIAKANNEQLYYYYLRVVGLLADSQNVERNMEVDRVLQWVTSCSSVALVQSFYNLVVKSRLRVEVSEGVGELYERVGQKLVHFVMTKGWKELLIHAEGARVKEYDLRFEGDIYREIECQILMFVALRALQGTPNEECSGFDPQRWQNFPPSKCEIIVKCREGGPFGKQIYLCFDGQYLNLKNNEQQLLNKSELLIQQLQFLQDEERTDRIDILGEGCNFYTSIHVDRYFSGYIMKEVRERREMAYRVHLELRQLRFWFKYD